MVSWTHSNIQVEFSENPHPDSVFSDLKISFHVEETPNCIEKH